MALVMHPIISSIQKIALYETKSVSKYHNFSTIVLYAFKAYWPIIIFLSFHRSISCYVA